jgi:hypothetical protein
MKRIIIIAIFIACWLTTAKAQMIVSAEKEIRDLETLRFQAMEKVDVATLDRIISDDLTYSKEAKCACVHTSLPPTQLIEEVDSCNLH